MNQLFNIKLLFNVLLGFIIIIAIVAAAYIAVALIWHLIDFTVNKRKE